MAKKKIVLMVSRLFPTTLTRRGEHTNFADAVARHRKIHTIRDNYDLWKLNEEKMQSGNYYISLRQWDGRPYNSKQTEVEQLTHPIGLQRIDIHHDIETDEITATLTDENRQIDWRLLAKNDGLNERDFREWFFGRSPQRSKTFHGVIIHFTPFRY
jgi:predicted nucleotidyltransferase component of viral defense system